MSLVKNKAGGSESGMFRACTFDSFHTSDGRRTSGWQAALCLSRCCPNETVLYHHDDTTGSTLALV